MYRDDCVGDAVRLKLLVHNDWNWVEVNLKHTDVVSIQKHMQNAKMSVPTLEKKNKKWFLRFAFLRRYGLTLWQKFQNARKEHNILRIL